MSFVLCFVLFADALNDKEPTQSGNSGEEIGDDDVAPAEGAGDQDSVVASIHAEDHLFINCITNFEVVVFWLLVRSHVGALPSDYARTWRVSCINPPILFQMDGLFFLLTR